MSDWATTLDTLLRERGSALFGYAYVLTGSASAAEDLLQDALVRTFRSGRATRDVNSAHAYVKKAITSAFIDDGRRASARPRAAGPAEMAGQDATPDPTEQVAARADLYTAILALPPRERACIVLHYLDDLPAGAVATELGVAVGTVKRYLSDGIARLRRTIGDVEFPEPADWIPVTQGRLR